MNTRLVALLIALTLPALSGCGNKGPLLLPEQPVLTEVSDSTMPATVEDAEAATPATDATMPPPVVPAVPTPPPADGGSGNG